MIKRMLMSLWLAGCAFSTVVEASVLPFYVNVNGAYASILTTHPTQTYASTGILVNSDGFVMNTCSAGAWCPIPVGLNSRSPYQFLISGPRGPLNFTLALNYKGPLSQQSINIPNRFVYFTTGADVNICNLRTIVGTNTTGNASVNSCVSAGGSNFSGPIELIGSPSGAFLYVANYNSDNGTSVTVCSVNQTTGVLSNCTAYTGGGMFLGPNGLAITPDGARLYVANHNTSASNVAVCPVSPSTGAIGQCVDAGVRITNPADVELSKDGLYAYIAGIQDGIFRCRVNSSTGGLSACVVTGMMRPGVEGLTVDPNGQFLYAMNDRTPYKGIEKCSIDSSNGLLYNCSVVFTDVDGYAAPAIFSNAAYMLLTNLANSIITACEIDQQSGNLRNCNPAASGVSPYNLVLR